MSIKNQYKPLKTAKKGLKILYLHGCTGSSPVPSTKGHLTALKGIKGHLRKLSDLFSLVISYYYIEKKGKGWSEILKNGSVYSPYIF